MKSIGIILPLVVVVVFATAAWAEDRQVKVELPLQTPRARESALGGPQDKAEFTVWIPAGVATVRGAVCNPFAKMEAVSQHWQAACRHWRFAYVQADFDAVKKDEFPLLETALARAAEQTGHAELTTMPLCFLGMSRGGGMSMNLAELMPARTIASAPVCLEVGPASPATRQIPVLTVFGDKDGSQLERLLQKLPDERRAGARWAIAAQWGRGHEFGQANNLSFVFFDDVIRTRLAEPATGAKAELQPYPLEQGWLAGPVLWVKNEPIQTPPVAAPWDKFAGEQATAVWLPTARTAAVWQAFVAPSKAVRIMEPAGLGDGQKFLLHSSEQSIKVVASIAGQRPESVEIWDADARLATLSAEPWEATIGPLQPGIHSLIVKAIEGEVVRSSRPHTIVVAEKTGSH